MAAVRNFYGQPQPIVEGPEVDPMIIQGGAPMSSAPMSQAAPAELNANYRPVMAALNTRGVATYSDGSFQDPMVSDQHGRPRGHMADGRKIDDKFGMADDSWDSFKQAVGASKAVAGTPPPKNKLPKGDNPKTPEEAVAISAAAHTPDDKEAFKELKGLIDKYENGDKKINLAPLIAWVDSTTGSRLSAGYDTPLSDEEREQITLELRGKLAQQEEALEYKREYLASQKEAAELRQQFAKEKADDDRDLKRELAHIRGAQQTAGGEDKDAQRHFSNKAKLFTQNKTAIKAVAKKRFGNPNNPDDKSYELRAGPLNDEIYEFGQYLEREEGVKKGQGYGAALEYYLNPENGGAGPDSGSGAA